MPELERMLSQLGGELDWPPTPDLARSVMARLDADAVAEGSGAERPAPKRPAAERPPAERPPAGRRRAFPIARRSLALAFVALLLLAGAAFAALPGVRHAVLDFFGLRGATVERRTTLPPAPPPRPLHLGTRSTLAEVRGRLGFAPLVPSDPGAPDGVYVRRTVPGGELSLTYRPRPGLPRARSTKLGLLVTEFRGDLSPEYAGKIAGQATRVERLRVDGDPAIWVAGAPHFFFYRTPDGRFEDRRLRIAQNVLLLQRGRLLIRLEGAMDRDRAVAIARSLR
jgi:hypothetical protein